MKVWVVVVDYGLNGASVLGVFAEKPTAATVKGLESDNFPDSSYGPTSVTGFSGTQVEEWEVTA